MSTEDYDRIEKLFCGSWKFIKHETENKEEFMSAAGKKNVYDLFLLDFFSFNLYEALGGSVLPCSLKIMH